MSTVNTILIAFGSFHFLVFCFFIRTCHGGPQQEVTRWSRPGQQEVTC